MTILLHTNALTRRGDSVTVMSYAKALHTYYNFECIIVYDIKNANNDDVVISLMRKEFNLFGYQNFQELEQFVLNKNASIIYWLKNGHYDDKLIKTCKNVIHVVISI